MKPSLQEAQRAADLGALAAARIISLEGVTGDPTAGPSDVAWTDICGGADAVPLPWLRLTWRSKI